MSEKIFTDLNFEEEVINSDKTVLVDFFASWCGPCKMQGPIVEDLAQEMGDSVKIGKLDVDANPETAQKFSVMSIPTIIIFKNGEAMQTLIGLQSKDGLKSELEKLI
jgi:thioredoxin 1